MGENLYCITLVPSSSTTVVTLMYIDSTFPTPTSCPTCTPGSTEHLLILPSQDCTEERNTFYTLKHEKVLAGINDI